MTDVTKPSRTVVEPMSVPYHLPTMSSHEVSAQILALVLIR